MEKEWIFKDRLSDEYYSGVQSFLRFAMQNVEDLNAMSCPCSSCGNLQTKKIGVVRMHLLANGMDKTYHKWIWHGEDPTLGESINGGDQVGISEDNLLREEPIDMVNAAYDETNDPDNFVKLLEDAEKPLYPGCSKFTKLSAIMKLYNLKAKYGWSDTSFNDLLVLIGQMLPEANELPLSLYDSKKSLNALGMNYLKIHACHNDCVLYWKEHEKRSDCPTCSVSRWKIGKNSKICEGVPAKVLWYFPPIPRFQRMFRNKVVSKELTWHADERVYDGQLRHPADSPSWRLVDHKWPEFASEKRNLRLALSADGINPYKTLSSTYSCWPVLLITYNLPPWLCMKRKFIMLTLLISGPKQPGNDIDVYLAPLIDDLKKLWEVGVDAYDGYRQQSFLLRAILLWTINDFPAYGNLSGCSVKGYHACPICGEETYAKRLKYGRKMSYTGHRRFLPLSHPYRRQKKAFNGDQEFNLAPKPLSGCEVLKKVESIKCSWGKMSRSYKSKENAGLTCSKKKSIFFQLEYWEHLHVRHVLDVMHIEKNVCESIIGTLLDIPGKTKDGIAARRDLEDMKVRSELAPVVEGNRIFLPAACYTLSREEKRKVCKSLAGIKVPTGYSSNFSNLVSMKDLKLIGLKSHDCHILMQQLLPVAIRGVLPDNVRHTITRLCFFFNRLCSKVIDVSKLDEMQSDIVKTLCLLEKYFPPSFFDIMVHLIVHLVREVKLCGPVWSIWMYPFERYMKILKGYVRNRNRPEGCIAECYIAEEALEFCSDYLSNLQSIGIPNSLRNYDRTKPLSAARLETIGYEEWVQAHRYVLTNDPDIDPYINEHMEYLKSSSLTKAKSQKWLLDQHNRLFINWLRDKVADEINGSLKPVSEKMKWISKGPNSLVAKFQAYLVNGVTYHTKDRDNIRASQNSGVSLVANIMQLASAKDKNPVTSDMEFYGVIKEIWELDYGNFRISMFKCNWVENNTGIMVDDFGFTLVNLNKVGFKNDSFILASQAKKVFFIEDPKDPTWYVVLAAPTREYPDCIESGDVEESAIHLHSFSKGLPPTDAIITDENEPPCVRDDCDGIWVDNTNV